MKIKNKTCFEIQIKIYTIYIILFWLRKRRLVNALQVEFILERLLHYYTLIISITRYYLSIFISEDLFCVLFGTMSKS